MPFEGYLQLYPRACPWPQVDEQASARSLSLALVTSSVTPTRRSGAEPRSRKTRARERIRPTPPRLEQAVFRLELPGLLPGPALSAVDQLMVVGVDGLELALVGRTSIGSPRWRLQLAASCGSRPARRRSPTPSAHRAHSSVRQLCSSPPSGEDYLLVRRGEPPRKESGVRALSKEARVRGA
jgi:hypothetical protein